MPDTQKLKPFISTWKFNCIAGTFCIKVKFLGNDFEQLVNTPKDIKTIDHKKVHSLDDVAIRDKINVLWKRDFYVAQRVESKLETFCYNLVFWIML